MKKNNGRTLPTTPIVSNTVDIVATTSDKVSTTTDEFADWKTYVDKENDFTVQYPSGLTPVVEKDPKYFVDNVKFVNQNGSTTFSIYMTVPNSRWPNLTVFLNDQYLMSKGGPDSIPVYKKLSSGHLFRDLGIMGTPGEHLFVGEISVGELSVSKFIMFSFRDESLIDKVFSTFLKEITIVAHDQDNTYTHFENNNILVITDDLGNKHTLDYSKAVLYEVGMDANGKLLQRPGDMTEWLKSRKYMWSSKYDGPGVPGSIKFLGTLDGKGIIQLTKIIQHVQ